MYDKKKKKAFIYNFGTINIIKKKKKKISTYTNMKAYPTV